MKSKIYKFLAAFKIELASAILMLIALFLLFSPEELVKHDKHKIGNIYSKTNDVRIKAKDSLVWYKIGVGSDISNGDKIFTSKKSMAVITFNGGEDSLLVNADSMVEVSTGNNGLIINSKNGSFSGNFKNKVNISYKTKDGIKKLTGKVVVLSSSHVNGFAHINVKKGHLTNSQTGKTIDVNGEKDKDKKNDKISKVDKLKLELFFPLDGYRYIKTQAKNKLHFKVKFINKKGIEYKILFSKTAFFDSIIKTKPVSNQPFWIDVRKFNGKIYWKVKGYKKHSETYTFNVSNFIPPKISNLRNSFDSKEGLALKGDLIPSSIFEMYQILISKDPIYSQIVVNKKYTKPSFSQTLKAGVYFLKIRNLYRGAHTSWTNSLKFSLVAKLFPIEFTSIHKGQTIYHTPKSKKKILFRWKQLAVKKIQYNFVLSSNKNFDIKSIIYKKNTQSHFVSYFLENDGKYYFQVIPSIKGEKRIDLASNSDFNLKSQKSFKAKNKIKSPLSRMSKIGINLLIAWLVLMIVFFIASKIL